MIGRILRLEGLIRIGIIYTKHVVTVLELLVNLIYPLYAIYKALHTLHTTGTVWRGQRGTMHSYKNNCATCIDR